MYTKLILQFLPSTRLSYKSGIISESIFQNEIFLRLAGMWLEGSALAERRARERGPGSGPGLGSGSKGHCSLKQMFVRSGLVWSGLVDGSWESGLFYNEINFICSLTR